MEELSKREAKLRRAQERATERQGQGQSADDAYQSDDDSDIDSESDDDEEEGKGQPRRKRSRLDLDSCTIKLDKLRQQEASHCQLAVYTENVCEKVLEDIGIKLQKGKARQSRLECNGAAFTQGRIDSKNINLDQQAIN
jgi:hypothetical protein